MAKKPPTPQESAESQNILVMSYQAQRQFLGYLGVVLPLSLWLSSTWAGVLLESSISDYYYTDMRNLLVGILCGIGFFLITYRGYPAKPGERITDRQVSLLAGLGALGVAFVPVQRAQLAICESVGTPAALISQENLVHFGSATLFFVATAIFCLYFFPKGERTPDGKPVWSRRRYAYYLYGIAIVFALVMLFRYEFSGCQARHEFDKIHYVFWWESIAVVGFALAWLTKGKADETITKTTRAALRRMTGA